MMNGSEALHSFAKPTECVAPDLATWSWVSIFGNVFGERSISPGVNKHQEEELYVYLIESIPNPKKRYVGRTNDIKRRMGEHNGGGTISTDENRPWKLVAFLKFENQFKAEKFEAYLKHGSGHTFANRHFW